MFTMIPSAATEPSSSLQICTLKSRTSSLFPSVAQSECNKKLLFRLEALPINVNNYKRRHTFPELVFLCILFSELLTQGGTIRPQSDSTY